MRKYPGRGGPTVIVVPLQQYPTDKIGPPKGKPTRPEARSRLPQAKVTAPTAIINAKIKLIFLFFIINIIIFGVGARYPNLNKFF